MEEKKKVVLIGLGILALLLAAGGIYYFFFYEKSEEVASGTAEPPSLPGEEKPPDKAERKIGPPPVGLDQSDDFIRQLASGLTSHPQLASWLRSKDIIRKVTAAVDNIAAGQSPRPQVDFFAPGERPRILEREGRIYLDPVSYERYNIVADVFDSLNSEDCARLYKSLKPLFEQAYIDLGYPQGNFDQALFRAFVVLLKTPVVEEDIELVKQVAVYSMADIRLENLDPAQKHLLRMGPENQQLIQTKLRQLALALGFAESALPRREVYRTGT
jgi:hypothetical protein